MSELEGVVKYSLAFTEKKHEFIKEYEELENLRFELFSLGLIGAYEDGIGYGNISKRINKSEKFLITSTQTGHLENLKQKDYSLVYDIDFKSFKTFSYGESKPSSECITHAGIYSLHKDINIVIHIHNNNLWKYMLKNNHLSTNDTPYGTPEMLNDVLKIYKNKDVFKNNLFVMQGHEDGIVSFGKDIKEAKEAIFKLIKEFL